jgi:hypothetical protein
MKWSSLSVVLVSLAVGGLACSGGSGQASDGSADGTAGGGRGGTGGRGGGGGAGASGSAGQGGTADGGPGGQGVAGTAGASGAGGATGGAGGATGGASGAGGATGGASGAGGATTTVTGGGGSGGGGNVGGTGGGGASGRGGTGGAGGRGGAGGGSGSGGAGGGGTGGTAGRGGAGGTDGSGGAGGGSGAAGNAGTSGRGGGAGGTAGTSGTAGVAGTGTSGTGGTGTAGTGGTASALRVTHAEALPNVQLASMLVVVDNQDTAVVVGPRAESELEDPGPRITWIPRQGSPHSSTFVNAVTPEAIAVDLSRNVWLAGQLYRPVSFGGPTLQPVESGYYLVALAPDGTHVSSHAVARPGTTYVHALTTDPQGNVYVVGSRSSVTFPSTDSVFVTKFSPAGVEIFNSEFPGQGSSAWANDVAVAPNGEVIIVGTYNGPVQFGTTTLTLPTGSIDTGFFAALDPDTGAARRAMRFGGPDFDVGNSIETTSTGALRVSGLVSGAATIGGTNVQADPRGSPFIAELTAAGAANWVALVDGSGIVFAADTNGADRTFAIGYLEGAIKETFVASVVADGTLTLPLRTPIASDTNGARFAAADRHGGVWVTGDFKGTVNFGSGPLDAGGPTKFGNFLIHLEP